MLNCRICNARMLVVAHSKRCSLTGKIIGAKIVGWGDALYNFPGREFFVCEKYPFTHRA